MISSRSILLAFLAIVLHASLLPSFVFAFIATPPSPFSLTTITSNSAAFFSRSSTPHTLSFSSFSSSSFSPSYSTFSPYKNYHRLHLSSPPISSSITTTTSTSSSKQTSRYPTLTTLLPLTRPIYLIGLPGSGKTSAGLEMKTILLHHDFVDTDAKIVDFANGLSILDIFKISGEKVFREYESSVLKTLATPQVEKQVKGQLISTGGGIIVTPCNLPLLKLGICVFLDVPIDVIVSRLKPDAVDRPLLSSSSAENENAEMKLRRLYDERYNIYMECANVHVYVSGTDNTVEVAGKISEGIVRLLEKEGSEGCCNV